mmetsp:Transcript_79540/g.206624  ORF Transcript_79540/g.206624 Transcript_79540/m.206624 type:complete len:210 (-) Transcript_79540:71-700(-)
MIWREWHTVHAPGQEHLTRRVEGGAERHGGSVAALVGVGAFKLDMLGHREILLHAAGQQHVPEVDTLPLSVADGRVPIDVASAVLNEVELLATAAAAHQGGPDLSNGKLAAQIFEREGGRLFDEPLHADGVAGSIQAGHWAVRPHEEEIRWSGVGAPEHVDRALQIGLPMPPHGWIPRHPSIWMSRGPFTLWYGGLHRQGLRHCGCRHG